MSQLDIDIQLWVLQILRCNVSLFKYVSKISEISDQKLF